MLPASACRGVPNQMALHVFLQQASGIFEKLSNDVNTARSASLSIKHNERMNTIYEYVVLSRTGVMVKGDLHLPNGTGIDRGTIKAAHEGARMAFKFGRDWDPFNIQVALRIKSKSLRSS